MTLALVGTHAGHSIAQPQPRTGEQPEQIDHGRFRGRAAATELQFSVDWYDVDLSDAIGQLGVQRIVDECRNAPGSQFCDYVFRDPGTNAVTAVRNPWLNINNARVRGLDYELLWTKDTDWFGNRPETFSLRFLAGRLLEDSTTTPGGQPVDLAGQLNEPENRAVATLRYQLGEWGFTWQQRYFGESELNVGTITLVQFVPGMPVTGSRATIDDATIDAKTYSDLTVSYDRERPNANPGSWRWRSRTPATRIRPSFRRSTSGSARKRIPRTLTTSTAGASSRRSATVSRRDVYKP